MIQALPATLLTYALTTEPSTLEVSASTTTPSLANFTFVVSCPRAVGSCTVSQLIVHLPVGDAADPTNLSSTPPSVGDASISSSDGAVWTPSLGVAPGLFVFTPPGGSVTIANQSLTITLSAIVMSTLVGTAEIAILEWASDALAPVPEASGPPSGQATIPVAKFPDGFYALDFQASKPQVNSGNGVTLSWVASRNAAISIAIADQPAVSVTGDSWPTPPLYTTTAFTLIATASQGGQTVALKLETIVIVASPLVTEFVPVPDVIGPGDQVVLHWRSVNADGVYLRTGQTSKQTLPAVSTPSFPVILVPKYGGSYTLQAFQNGPDGPVTSDAVPLSYTFLPLTIEHFSATPTTVSAAAPLTTLSWAVEHATAVTLQGQPVDASGSLDDSPTSNTTYELVATWVDGSQVSAPPVTVTALTVQVESCTGTEVDGA